MYGLRQLHLHYLNLHAYTQCMVYSSGYVLLVLANMILVHIHPYTLYLLYILAIMTSVLLSLQS